MLLRIFFCVLFAGVFANDRYESYETAAKEIYHKLNSDYNPHIPPNRTVVVLVDVFVRKLEKLDDINMVRLKSIKSSIAVINSTSAKEYSVELTLRQRWNDQRLGFDKFPFITSSDLSKFWIPDTFFTNEKKGHFHNIVTPNLYLRIFANGTILYSTRVSLRLSCPMNLKSFPMDRQVCNMRMASFGYTSNYLEYLWKDVEPVQVVPQLNLQEFELEGIHNDYCSVRTNTGEFSCLKVDFLFKRHFTPYLLQIYMPCCMLILISWLPFWLEKKAFLARILIDVTLLLFTLAFIQNLNSSLPAVSYLKAIDVWIYGCLGFIFTSLICVVPASKFSKKPKAACSSSDPTSDVDTTYNNEMEHKNISPVKEYHLRGRLKKILFKDSNLIYRVMFPTAFLLFSFAHYKMAKAGGDL